MVGRERRGGRQRRAGRAVTHTPVQPAAVLGDPATVLVDSERARPSRPPADGVSRAHGAKRRERPPTPHAPQGRGAQRRSRERSSREVPSGSTEDERSESSGANEGQRDAVSRGRGTSSGRGLSGVVVVYEPDRANDLVTRPVHQEGRRHHPG